MKLKIKKNDLVRVIAGNSKDKEGKVLALYPDKMRVIVEGVNIRKRHVRANQRNPQGEIVSREMPIHYSNIMLLDSKGEITRIGKKISDEKKVRIARSTGEEI